jgi:hypothetical protein
MQPCLKISCDICRYFLINWASYIKIKNTFLNIFIQKMGVYNIKAVIWAIMPQPRMDAILQVGFSCQQCADVLFKRALTLYSIDL